MIGDVLIAALLAGAGILATRAWQARMDRRAADVDRREPGIRQFYDRQRSEQLVASRDA